MGIRSSIGTWFLNTGRSMGRRLGCELVVEVGDELETSMQPPNTDKWGWDSSMYHKGQLFIKGYSNCVKPIAHETPHPKEPDEPDMEISDAPEEGETALPGVDEEGVVFDLEPSYRYRQHQDQHVLSEFLNPTERWTLLVYGMLGLGALMFINMIVVLFTGGSF